MTNNRRPTVEQVAARHGEIRKHWRKQRKRRAEERPSEPENVRIAHLRWHTLQRLMRRWYGIVMPETDRARAHLAILINYALLTNRKPQHVVEIWAPWMDQDEADQMAAQQPVLHKKGDLGQKLGLLECDRHAVRADTIGCVDKTDAECEQLRCQRRNERKRERRAAAKQETNTMTTETAPMGLKPKARKVLDRIDTDEIAVPDLVRRVAPLKEFSKLADPRRELYSVLDHLKALGLVTDRYEPNPRGGRQIRFVWRQQ